jgi:hypothetical protein
LAPPSARPAVSSELNSRRDATRAKIMRVLTLNMKWFSFIDRNVFTEKDRNFRDAI